MGLLSFLFRAARTVGGAISGQRNVQQQSPRLMTPAEQRQVAARTTPEAMQHDDWQGGSSSWIAALRYSAFGTFGQMRVKKGGKVYTFAAMAFQTFKSWKESPSWGRFFNANLKGRYSKV